MNKKWEYFNQYGSSLLESELNRLGSDGWELVSVGYNDGGYPKRWIFKRAVL